MSAAKHTQDGPWLDAGLTASNPVITGGPLRLIKCNGVVVAFLPAWLDAANEAAEAHANARLIAAAPELLAVLRDALLALESHGVAKGVQIDARAALAKATGSAT